MCLNYISTLFPYWEKHKIHFQSSSEKNWVMESFPKKEICHQTLGHINRTVNLFWITSVPYFLIEKTAKYIFRASSEKKLGDGNLFPKGNLSTKHRYINRTVNLFELHQYLISLLRKTQIHLQSRWRKKKWGWEFFPKRKLSTKW